MTPLFLVQVTSPSADNKISGLKQDILCGLILDCSNFPPPIALLNHPSQLAPTGMRFCSLDLLQFTSSANDASYATSYPSAQVWKFRPSN